MSDTVHVAVAVIVNEKNKVCISLRHKASHQGGLWEFPGGKIESDETDEKALIREIKEELNLDIKQSRPLIKINHHYPDDNKTVCLHVRKVISYQGEALGVEGQQVRWISIARLPDYDFPAANQAIIKALRLPDKYLITGSFVDSADFCHKLQNALNKNIKLVQLRLKNSSFNDMSQAYALLEQASLLCRQSDAMLMLNLPPNLIEALDLSQLDYDGIHADSRTLNLMSAGEAQKIHSEKLLSASCHTREELMKAVQLQSDFVVLSPVQKTSSHPDTPALGWGMFTSMIEDVALPVYALGGVSDDDVSTSWLHGAQGVAAISAFWK